MNFLVMKKRIDSRIKSSLWLCIARICVMLLSMRQGRWMSRSPGAGLMLANGLGRRRKMRQRFELCKVLLSIGDSYFAIRIFRLQPIFAPPVACKYLPFSIAGSDFKQSVLIIYGRIESRVLSSLLFQTAFKPVTPWMTST